jgi:hypothetical protein
MLSIYPPSVSLTGLRWTQRNARQADDEHRAVGEGGLGRGPPMLLLQVTRLAITMQIPLYMIFLYMLR